MPPAGCSLPRAVIECRLVFKSYKILLRRNSRSNWFFDKLMYEALLNLTANNKTKGKFMKVKHLRALIVVSIVLWISSSYAHNKVVVVPLGGNDAPPPTVYAIGDTGPAGGIVFYVTDGGLHGLEAAPNDSAMSPWGCAGDEITGADGTAIGTGAQNTADIRAECFQPGIAAWCGVDLYPCALMGWFLPSLGELNELYLQRAVVAGFITNRYWSSSETTDVLSFSLNFDDGGTDFESKNTSLGVRVIRAF